MNKEEKEAADNKIKYRVIEVFNNSHKNYGTRRIKAELVEKSIVVSRRRIGIIMKEFGLKSTYTVKKYHPISKKGCNESSIGNTLNRCFDNRAENEVMVSDLTYVRVSDSWNYICTLVDLHNRGIIGWSVGTEKSAELVLWAFFKCKYRFEESQNISYQQGERVLQ